MLDDIEDIDDSERSLCHKLSRALKTRMGVRLFNRLRDRLEATTSQDRIITLAIMTEVSGPIQANQAITIVSRDTAARLQVEVVDWRLVDEIHTHGRVLDGPIFRD